ncbi:malonate decarboxylase subunit alpha [Acinetobacter baumannii]
MSHTGPSTEDSPALIEPAAFSDGIVIVQVNELVDDVSELPVSIFLLLGLIMWWWRIQPFYIEPLFTRDPETH